MAWRFSVSTLGIPSEPLEEVIALARANFCEGLELRVHPDEFLHLGLNAAEARHIGEQVREGGLEISGLAGYAKVCSPTPDGDVISEIRSLITLASLTGAPAVRVFPGGDAEAEPAEHRDRAQRRIAALLDDAREAGVTILVETHDSHPTGARSIGLVKEFNDPQHAAILWDGLHPWRSGESPAKTLEILGEYFAYFQVKDAVKHTAEDGTQKWVPTLCGEGQVPLEDQGALLQDFSGWVSLEWEKAWHPQIEPLDKALPLAASWFHGWNPKGSAS